MLAKPPFSSVTISVSRVVPISPDAGRITTVRLVPVPVMTTFCGGMSVEFSEIGVRPRLTGGVSASLTTKGRPALAVSSSMTWLAMVEIVGRSFSASTLRFTVIGPAMRLLLSVT